MRNHCSVTANHDQMCPQPTYATYDLAHILSIVSGFLSLLILVRQSTMIAFTCWPSLSEALRTSPVLSVFSFASLLDLLALGKWSPLLFGLAAYGCSVFVPVIGIICQLFLHQVWIALLDINATLILCPLALVPHTR
jgi:hypothetical protein